MVAILAALVACTPTQITTALDTTASAMCDAQRAANLVGDIAAARGNERAAAVASTASTLTGKLCTWGAPAPAPK